MIGSNVIALRASASAWNASLRGCFADAGLGITMNSARIAHAIASLVTHFGSHSNPAILEAQPTRLDSPVPYSSDSILSVSRWCDYEGALGTTRELLRQYSEDEANVAVCVAMQCQTKGPKVNIP